MRAFSRYAVPITAAFALLGWCGSTTAQQPTDPDRLYRLVKRFDFNERPLGNFESEPMHWSRFAGDGLPMYNRGAFDDTVGHDAPPSFKLSIQTGNVAYEYSHVDLAIVPGSDYVVRGHVRAVGLEHSRAFLAAHLVDRFGERIPDSDRVTNLIASTRPVATAVGRDAAEEPWQPIELTVPGEFPTAHTLRVQCWILQTSCWRPADAVAVDPIARRDVHGTAWFDDLGVFRIPRARLRLSNPGGFVVPERPSWFVVDVNNATAQALTAEIRVANQDGQVVHDAAIEVPSATSTQTFGRGNGARRSRDRREYETAAHSDVPLGSVRTPVPTLAPGLYDAHLRLRIDSQALLERRLRFAVLAPMPRLVSRTPDIGVDIGAWRGGDIEGAAELLSELGCGAAKIGVELANEAGNSRRFGEITILLRELAKRRIEALGVMLPPSDAAAAASGTLHRLITREAGWRTLVSPAAAHFGGEMPIWQLGEEVFETTRGTEWQPAQVAAVREYLKRFATAPEIVTPRSLTDASPPASTIVSLLVPPHLPARDLPSLLAPLTTGADTTNWLKLSAPPADEFGEHPSRIDLARRFILSKAVGLPRLYVDAPFRAVREGDDINWEPTDDYPVLRTLIRHLAGKRLTAAMQPEPDVIALVFQGGEDSCLVLWSWRDPPATPRLPLYLGQSPRATDLLGLPVPLELGGHVSWIPVDTAPILITNLRTPLTMLQASFGIAPTFLQAHEPEVKPVMRFRNPFSTPLSGEATFDVPSDWRLHRRTLSFDLGPGETLEKPLEVSLSPRQVASTYNVGIRLKLNGPENTELSFSRRFEVGLRDITVDVRLHWDADTLIVEHSLRNLTGEKVRFSGFCEAPGRARAEGLFLDVGQGEVQAQTYVYRDARDLVGQSFRVGIQEVRGERRLDKLVEITGE